MKRTQLVARAEALEQAREEFASCGEERMGVLLRNLFGCLAVLDASDIELLDLAKGRFPENREIVTLATRLISKIPGDEPGGGIGAVSR